MIRSLESRFGRFKDLKPHALGYNYSIALAQANSYLDYLGEDLTTPSVTYVGVYDGHGEPEADRFIREMLFHNINNRAIDWGADFSNRSSSSSSLRMDNLTLPAERPNEKKPPGLSQDAIEALPMEIFCGEINKVSNKECGFCLESFREGDKLMWLPCKHRFHSICLDPWIRACGDCPYCRNAITETRSP